MFLDMHCDTITKIMLSNENLYENKKSVNIKRMLEANLNAQIFAVFIDKQQYSSPLKQALKSIAFFNDTMAQYSEYIFHALDCNSIDEKRINAFLSIEGGEVLEGDISVLKIMHALGVRLMTLTWNYENEIGFGAKTGSDKGLNDFGREVIFEMNKRGMIVDVSHLNDAGFDDVAQICKQPFVASHSNARSVCGHIRNLTDEQIKIISDKGGVIGLNMFPYFLSDTGKASIEDIIFHAKHIIKIGGADVLCLGCDFDGITETPLGIDSVTDLAKIELELLKSFDAVTVEKIKFKNALRVMGDVLGF